MALKDDIKAIKTGLSTEEQMIENFIKGERFFKKYKYYILALVLALVVYFVYDYASGVIHEKNTKANNEIYANLMQDPNNTQNLDLLKEKNANLYALFLLAHEKDMSDFETRFAELEKLKLDPLLISILKSDLNNSTFLRNYNKLLQAFELLEEGKIEQAQLLLAQIPTTSELRGLANNFKHYKGIKQ
ncbi:hypothetical protein DMB95_02465 [Campylobacter sp. MIT 12-8780]|uniref:hypothetical protein n=1 Tax=unclassified Campylobacter TaxID=2593542 RepID=UPI00115E087D|nr:MULTISPECIES: hypothetical protein [unclassified Campylobacter]NDJ26673.1 hypothetical protein [Campylobacter sp. MIT 19-121]TQR42499.1 hypothetical protein DMB95_02465 [Campylobacter sp. MIT 12-8780]